MTGQPQDRDERTGAELLRDAARLMREDYGPDADVEGCPEGDPFMLAVIDWLDWMAGRADSGNGIPAMRGQGLEQAIATARAYLTQETR